MPQSQSTVMADFVFGGIEADEQRLLATERARHSGVRHFHQIAPLDPQPGDPVTITVEVGPDVTVDRVHAYVTVDGSEPEGVCGVAHNGLAIPLALVETRWEPLLWDYVDVWRAEIPGQPDGTLVQYRVQGWSTVDPQVVHWSREQNIDRTVERPARYGYTVDTFAPPAWAREAVIYHVFVDRFTGVENRWLEPAEMEQFAGGTLAGVTEKLDYIAALGVTALWLSPFFKTSFYHGYDTVDFYTVDPRFGSNADVRALVDAAHARGLRVILDFVANHVGTGFAPFAAAAADPADPHRAWFSFGPEYKHGYRSFFDVAAMPQLDTDHPDARRYLLDAAQFWLREYDVDGYRLDYAAGPSHLFWNHFRAACRAVKPDCLLFGEVTHAGAQLRTYTGRLDGCLDFAFCRSVRQLCAGATPAISLAQFANTIQRSRRYFGQPDQFILPAFIDNHDMNRFLAVADDDVARLKLAAALLFALGDTPILYYGTEVGLSQPRLKGPYREESRHPMRWGDAQDRELLAWFKEWIALRRAHPALSDGEVRTLHLDEKAGVWEFARVGVHDEVRFRLDLRARTVTHLG
ncbi:MAG: alpha-amylase [Caldilineaceae bacterium]|nr:alpha-amylase [Caldilineaceae bacterium]